MAMDKEEDVVVYSGIRRFLNATQTGQLFPFNWEDSLISK